MSAYFRVNIKLVLILLLILFLVPVYAEVKQFPQLTLYQCYTSDELLVAWDNPDSLFTEFYIWNIGEQKRYLSGNSSGSEVRFKIPRTGVYSFWLRFRLQDGQYTEWASSEDSQVAQIKPIGQTEYVQGAWIVYGHVAPPTGGGVETTREGVKKSNKKK